MDLQRGVRSAVAAALLAVWGTAELGVAQESEPPDAAEMRCRAALVERGLDTGAGRGFCRQLATLVTDSVAGRAWMSARDVAPSSAGTASPAGSPAQGEAVPTVQPTPFVAAALGQAGTEGGAATFTCITINPWTTFGAAGDAATVARNARRGDVTVFLPANSWGTEDKGRPDYLGVRFRYNASAVSQSSALLRHVEARMLGRKCSFADVIPIHSQSRGAS